MKQFFFKEHKFSLFEKELPVLSGIHPMTYHYDLRYYPHRHYYATLVFQVNGCSEQWINGRKYEMQKGDFLMIDRESMHMEIGLEKEHCKLIGISFERTNFTGLPEGKMLPDTASPLIHCQDCYSEVIGLLREIDAVCWERARFCDEISKINTMKLLYSVYQRLEPLSEAEKPSCELVEKVKHYLDEHYSESISIEQLAGLFFVSESHLLHSFKNAMNCSPRNYQIDRRIGETQFLLLHTDYPMQRIAETVGYDNANYLIKLFRKRVGMTPAEFRIHFSMEKNTSV